LFVLGFPNPFPGAGWTRIGFFAEDWSKKGHAVEVLGAFSYKAFHKRGAKRMGGINVFNLIFNMGLTHPLIFILNTLISFAVSTLTLLSRKPNAAIVSVPTGDVGVGALMACRLTRTKCVVDYRDEWEDYVISLTDSNTEKFLYSVLKKLSASIYAKSQIVTAVTPNLVDSLKSRGVANVRLVPNGADVTVFKQYDKNIIRRKLGLGNNDFIIVYSGGIGGYYKLDNVIGALTKLLSQTKNVKLLMIGDGPDVPRVLTLSKNLGLHENVLYLGVKNDKKEIAEILSAGDVGIIPGLYTKGQLPVKLFEYGACGLPIVATVYSDSMLSKLIKEYAIGVTAAPMDEEKLAEAIYFIYENESFRVAAGKRARLLIEEKFDRNKIAAEFLNLVREFA
jgi:glycosyltransferase involved in cell wall biosynthesis